MYAAVHGVGDGEKRESDLMGTGAKQGLETRTVVFVSLLRPLSLWIDMGKKLVGLFAVSSFSLWVGV